jgi:RNA polymerase sigma-70 factor (ECF subfamily)
MNAQVTLPFHATLASVIEDEAAFRAWYDEVMPRVYRYLAARCGGDVHLAEELTQQTFVDAVRQRNRFDGRSEVVTWLVAIARNKLVDHYRRRGREAQRHDRLVALHSTHDERPWRAVELRDAVATALDRVPGDQRLALLFRHLDGLSVREVGAVIGRSEKATESLLARARDTFRRAYGDQTDA